MITETVTQTTMQQGAQSNSQSNAARRTQCRFILQHLVKQGPISQAQAEQLYAVWRLAAVIRRLKQPPFQITIETQMQSGVNSATGKPCRYAVYSIPESAKHYAGLLSAQPFYRGDIVRHRQLHSRIKVVRSVKIGTFAPRFMAYGSTQTFLCSEYELL